MKIYTIARSKGKRIQIYGDIIMKYPHLIRELPGDILLINWGYEADHPFEIECAQIAAADIPFYVCTGNSAWNSISGRWKNARSNIARGAAQGLMNGAEGLMVSEWGDNGHWQQISTGLPGFLYGACAAWNVDAITETESSTASFEPVQALALHVFEGNSNLARAEMLLQSVGEQTGVQLHNASLPAVLMLDPVFPYYRGEYQQFRDYSFDKELKLLDSARELLGAATSSPELSQKNAHFAEELSLGQRLLQHGCRLGRLQMATANLTVAEIAAAEREALAAELKPLLGEYRRLWLRRSRPGGLSDSVARLESLLQSYRSGR